MGIILILKASNRIETNCFLQIIKKKENARVSNLKINVGFLSGEKDNCVFINCFHNVF